MKKSILIPILLIQLAFCPIALTSQATVQGDTVYYLESHQVEYSQSVYKSAVSIDELDFPINENLALRVYYPTDLNPGEKRPLIVLVHGGGFIGGTYTSFFNNAEALAGLGFIAASVQYRLCKRNDCLLAAGLSFPCNVSWHNSLVPSAYVAATDVADAIRWLQDHAEEYQIDPDRVVVGGHSAGGWTSLHMAFMDMDEVTEICPSCGTWPDYLADSLQTPDGVRAVINMSGAILDTSWIDSEEVEIDLMTIHGTHDGVVYYGTAPVYPCCNTYTVPVEGACPTTIRHRSLGGNTYLFTGQDYGHDVFEASWWEQSENQILWFLGKSLFSDDSYNQHVSVQRPNPVLTCPSPLPLIEPAIECGLSNQNLGIVLFDSIVSNTKSVLTQADVHIFPNPATNQLFLDVNFPKKSTPRTWEMNIYNYMGVNVLKKEFFPRSSFSNESILVNNLPTGAYFVEFRTSYEVFYRKKILISRIY
jgi:predicted esterase